MKSSLMTLWLARKVEWCGCRLMLLLAPTLSTSVEPSLEVAPLCDSLLLDYRRKEDPVGKWASQKKRGSNTMLGLIPPPLLADFTIGTITATTIPVNRIPAIPAPADRWGLLVVNKATRAVAFTAGVSAATPITATALTTATTYEVRIGWFSQTGQRLSDWSPSVDVTTA